jgi:hypothetical protein
VRLGFSSGGHSDSSMAFGALEETSCIINSCKKTVVLVGN